MAASYDLLYRLGKDYEKPEFNIKSVKVVGFDRSIVEFHFDQEKVDPPLDDKLFRFELPKGATLVEASQ